MIQLGNIKVYTKHEVTVARAEQMCYLGNGLYISENTRMDDIYQAAGLKTYDHAKPQAWFDEYLRKHGEPPRGVWSYDKNRVMGEFVSLGDCLTLIGQAAQRLLAEAI